MDDRIAQPPPPGIAISTNAWTAPFWAAAARHELLFARCGRCGRYRMPPTPFCPWCHAQEIDWQPAGGEALLYSYTIVDRAVVPGTEASLPYVPAIIAYPRADGIRLIANIVGSPLHALRVGAPVTLGWHDLPDGNAIPVYRIADPR